MIRQATISDASRIAEIDVAAERFAYKDFLQEELLYKNLQVEDRINRVKKWISEKMFDIFVYEDDATGTVKGMMGFGQCGDDDKKNAFELHFLYVEPNFSHGGIGSKMISFFEQAGKQKGYTEFVIWVLQDNLIGINCYQKNGYSCDGSTKLFQRFNKNEARFVKKLT
ncbi:MAG: GNAT family N-acetyltransferase [Treponema sp.]|nr:GNAT family N-acetyltransferase [Treponema sp.]